VRRALLPLLLAALLGPASAGATPTGTAGGVDLLKVFRKELPRVKRATRVPILLPDRLLLAGEAPKLYADGGAQRGGWVLVLAGAPRCGSANACFVASFEAKRGGRLPERANLRLAGGVPAFFLPIRCGASCRPASLWFVHGGVLYSWQVKDAPRAVRTALARMAGEAIRAGPR